MKLAVVMVRTELLTVLLAFVVIFSTNGFSTGL